jgi:hypothetical protein
MRFAGPKKSRQAVLGRSPGRPDIKEPGHRYGQGSPLRGASLKGRHYSDFRSNGQDRRSPLTPRSPSPANSRHSRDDITLESAVPPSTRKPFEKPKRNERSPRKETLPLDARSLSGGGSRSGTPTRVISRDGFSVNADFVSVTSESYGGGRGARSTSSVASNSRNNQTRTSGSAGFFGSSDNQSVSGHSVMSGRSTSSRFSTSGTISQVSTSTLFHPLSQASPPSHGIHNIQLSQNAFRSVRKACVRDAISQFLEGEEIFQEDLEQSHQQQQYYNRSYSGSFSPTSQGGNNNNNNTQGVEEQQSYNRRKHQRIMKMTEVLRDSIRNELQSYPFPVAENSHNIFFPSENMYDNNVITIRAEIASILSDWKKQYMKETLQVLDKYFQNWELNRNELIELKKDYYQGKIPYFQHIIETKAEKQRELIYLKRLAEEYGLNVSPLLAKFPKHWFNENALRDTDDEEDRDMAYQYYDLNELNNNLESSPQQRGRGRRGRKNNRRKGSGRGEFSLSGDEYEDEDEDNHDYLSNSVFLSPHLLQVTRVNSSEAVLGNDYYVENDMDQPLPNNNQISPTKQLKSPNSSFLMKNSSSSKQQQQQQPSPSRSGKKLNLTDLRTTSMEQQSQSQQSPRSHSQYPQPEWSATDMLQHSAFVPYMNTNPDQVIFSPNQSNNNNNNGQFSFEETKTPQSKEQLPQLPQQFPPSVPSTPYQVSHYNQMLSAPSPKDPLKESDKLKINYNVIRVLAAQQPLPPPPSGLVHSSSFSQPPPSLQSPGVIGTQTVSFSSPVMHHHQITTANNNNNQNNINKSFQFRRSSSLTLQVDDNSPVSNSGYVFPETPGTLATKNTLAYSVTTDGGSSIGNGSNNNGGNFTPSPVSAPAPKMTMMNNSNNNNNNNNNIIKGGFSSPVGQQAQPQPQAPFSVASTTSNATTLSSHQNNNSPNKPPPPPPRQSFTSSISEGGPGEEEGGGGAADDQSSVNISQLSEDKERGKETAANRKLLQNNIMKKFSRKK